jgi:LysR family glycine cleavage system transcriptional activator
MVTRLPPLNSLHAFVVTAHYLNLTRAAEALCVTQGAVSRQIAALESHFGVTLFQRQARGLALTPQGQSLLPGIQAAFDLIRQSAEQLQRDTHIIRMKAPTCAMRWLVPQLIALEQQKLDIQVALTTTTAHSVDFQTERFDAAVIFAEHPPQFPYQYKLFDEELIAVLSPTLASQLTELGLSALTFLHPTQDGRDWKLWLGAQPKLEVTRPRNQHFDTMDLAISAAIQGFGIAMADKTLVAEDVRMQRLVSPFSFSVKTGAAYYVVHPHALQTGTHVAALMTWFQQRIDPTQALPL